MILATPAEQKGKPKPVALGLIGELHPAVRDAFDLASASTCWPWTSTASSPWPAGGRPTSPWPSSRRWCRTWPWWWTPRSRRPRWRRPSGTAAASCCARLAFFDRYQGDPIPAGKVSLAYSLTFQADDRTLTDEDVAAAQKKILGRLAAEVGGAPR